MVNDDERCPECDSPNISYSSIFGLKCDDCGLGKVEENPNQVENPNQE